MTFDINWEKNIYSKAHQINKYPYGELVSVFFNSLKFLKNNTERKNINVLELGCGAGNNLWFIAEQGFNVFGVDGSKTACEYAKKSLVDRRLKGQIHHAYFDNLPFEDNSFDIIVDRTATYCGTLQNIKQWWDEANRVLKKNGLVISFMFTDKSPHLKRIKKEKYYAEKIEHNTYTNINNGTFKNTGVIHFTEYSELKDIFHFLDIKQINIHTGDIIYNSINSNYGFSEWIIVGIKK